MNRSDAFNLLTRLAALSLALVLNSGRVHATDYWVVENQTDAVYRVNVVTRTATLVGPAGVDVQFGGLGFTPIGSTLYAWITIPNAGGNLYQVNKATGAFSLIGGSSLNGADT